MPFQSLHQNLNQIAQICGQLSQNEQANVSKLQQMQQAERNATQQLQQVVQMCNQMSQQMQQISGTQFAGAGQFTTGGAGQITTTGGQGQYAYPAGGGGGGGTYQAWSNRPVNTSNAFLGQQGGQFGGFEASKELGPTGQAAFNTNKDLNN